MSWIETAGTPQLLAWLEGFSGLALVFIFIFLGILIALADAIGKKDPDNPELTRKIVHIGASNVILLAWWWEIPTVVILVAALLAGLVAIASYSLPILSSINSVGRKSWGTFFYAVSIGLLVGYFWPIHQPLYAAIGILIMGWGDGMAALVGQNFGKHPYQFWGMGKSWEGSITMAAVSFVITSTLLLLVQGSDWKTWGVSFGVAIAAAILEVFSKWGIDNLVVPLGSASLAFILNARIL